MITTVLLLVAAWHAAGTWHFTVTPARSIARATAERPVNVVATELFRFLGGLNAALVVLALLAAWDPASRRAALLTLCVANATQLAQDVRVLRLGLARGPFLLQILAGDAAFAVLTGVAAVAA